MSEYKIGILKELTDNQNRLLAFLGTITEAQFSYQPADGRWSIAGLIEHIILSEKAIIKGIQKFGEKPSEKEVVANLTHKQIEEVTNDRSKKYDAPAPFIPKGIFVDKGMAIEAFKVHRVSMEEFIRTTELPLKQISFPHFAFGMLDGRSWLSFIVGHCDRHILQMEEIKEAY